MIMDAEINLTPTAKLFDIQPSEKRSYQGTKSSIPARSWGPASECFAGALLVHGMGGHSAWFEAFGRRLKVQRMFVMAYDQVGFGQRINEKFTSYSQWLDDLVVAYDYQKSLIGARPLYIMGNSMGAAVALKAVAEGYVDPKGLALFSPGLEGNAKTFPLTMKLSALWQSFLDPDRLVALPYGPDKITGNPQIRLILGKDPLMRAAVPANMLWQLLQMTANLKDKCANIKPPVLMLEAGIEQIVSRDANRKLFDSIRAFKVSKTYENAWHDLMFDPLLDEVVKDIMGWIETSH
jgi:alpha-beta hydrolase superfamily lysophospholipase